MEQTLTKVKEKLKYEKETRLNRTIEWLQTMKPFANDDCIPEPPVLGKELYWRYVIPNFIRCGAIPKDELIVGETYVGSCRNANEAVWLGDHFEYERIKFGYKHTAKIKHFMDDDFTGIDVFVPLRKK